jgi:glycosyltransferase involved in cell wall biosynthesis
MKIAVIANTGWYIYNFRRNLMLALQAAGHEVFAVSPSDGYSARLRCDGVTHLAWRLSGAGIDPWTELRAVMRLRSLLAAHGIEMVLSYTPKGNVYSGLASTGTSRILIPNVSGMGRAFTEGSWLSPIVKALYRAALARAAYVFFQNEDDRETLVSSGIVARENTERLMGSGIDLARFEAAPLPCTRAGAGDGAVVFLLVARLLWEKGIAQYVEAARMIKARSPAVRCRLLGALAPVGEAAVAQRDLDAWQRDGVIEYLGTTDDVPGVLRGADCVVLPSYYREGVPRSLLEGAAMGRACITTDTPGCRDVVEHGVTGWLCAPRDAPGLFDRMSEFVDLPPARRQAMGLRSRQRVEHLFDERVVIARYLDVATALAAGSPAGDSHAASIHMPHLDGGDLRQDYPRGGSVGVAASGRAPTSPGGGGCGRS